MPVLPGAAPNINSAVVGSWNAYDLVQLVSQRIPGYQFVEYLREVNDAYQELWRETVLLDNDYFTAQATVTVAIQSQIFDLRYNQGGALGTGPGIHPRLYQPVRIRVLPPVGIDWFRTEANAWNDDVELSYEQDSSQPASTTGTYRWQYFSRGLLRFARPLPIGTQIEVTYTFSYFELNSLGNGTISTTGGNAVFTGASTTFTQLLGPDFASFLTFPPTLPSVANLELPVECEIIVNPSTTPQAWRIIEIQNDTSLFANLNVPIFGAGTPYALATIPDIPEPHRRLIATLATRNMLATPAITQDARFAYWDQKAERDLDRYRDSIVERQQQNVPKRGRFPLSMTRRGWSTGVQ